MAFQRRPRIIPGFTAEQSAALFAQFAPTDDTVQALSTKDASTRIETGDLAARAGQFLRVSPGVDGMALLLPSPDLTRPGDRVTVSLESPGAPLRVSCVPNRTNAAQVTRGVVNGQSRATFTVAGLLVFTSNGATGWTTPAEHPAESAALTLAIIQAAAADEAAAVGWGDVLLVDRHSGFVTPIIDSGAALNFASGATGITADADLTVDCVGAFELDSTDAHLHPTGALHLGHEGLTASIHQGCVGTWAGVAGDFSLDSGADAKIHVSGLVELATAAVVRLQIDATGAWYLHGDPGTSGYVLTSQGTGAEPLWVDPDTLVTPYTAGDGIDLAAFVFSVDVTDIVDGVSITEVATNNIQRAALTGAITASAGGNATTFGVAGTQSVLVNATNSVAVPAFLSAGPTGFVYLRNNAAGTALEWGSLSSHASTSIVYSSNTFVRAALTGAITASQNSNATLFDAGASGAGLTGGGTAVLAVGAGDDITVNANDVAWSGVQTLDDAGTLLGRARFLQSAPGNAIASNWSFITNDTFMGYDYVGSASTINSATTSGALGVVDISTLKCGGTLTLQSVTAATISGFTAKTDGFWFCVVMRDNSTNEYVTLLDDLGATTSIRTPGLRDWRLTKTEVAMLLYSNNRWYVVNSIAKLWMPSSDSPTWAAQQDNYARTQTGISCLRVTLTGSQTLTGIVPEPTGNGELLSIFNIDSTDTLTIAHDATSTAANRFYLPDSVDMKLGPRAGALFRYDATNSRWRALTPSPHGRLLARTVLTTGTAATFTHHTEARFFTTEGVGGGAAGGGVANVAGACGACGGSGTWGKHLWTIAATTSTYTVGAAGAGVSGATGSSGTASSWAHNGTTLGLPPGTGGGALAGAGTIGKIAGGAGGGNPTGFTPDESCNGQKGGDGCRPSATTGFGCQMGPAGSTPLGNGGAANTATTAQVLGNAGTGYGAGGSGALEGSSTTAAKAGASGTAGVWIVEEFS